MLRRRRRYQLVCYPAGLPDALAAERAFRDSFWIEVCRIVHEDGIPRTQSELVNRMNEWFDDQDRGSPDTSTIKKKLKPLWHTLRPAEPEQTLSRAV